MVVATGLTVAGLFAGIGGVELGLRRAGFETRLLCEWDEAATRVLAHRFPDVPRHGDVRTLAALPDVDVVAAGFPCQDLSQAGRTAGIGGTRSGLVGEVFRLVSRHAPRWLLLENVPFMLSLERGRAMEHLTSSLAQLGYRWAYRVVDSRAFGLPQRRRRVLLLASQTENPADVLLADEVGAPAERALEGRAAGFYWTEGLRGLGWAVDALPTLKGGSTVGIPSPPAYWTPEGWILTPDLRDAERLQGFPADWTIEMLASGSAAQRVGVRWKGVGNAVSVPLAKWAGHCLRDPRDYDGRADRRWVAGERWPDAAWSDGRETRVATRSAWPVRRRRPALLRFLAHPGRPLSARATRGFLARARRSTLRFQPGFLAAVEAHGRRLADDATWRPPTCHEAGASPADRPQRQTRG